MKQRNDPKEKNEVILQPDDLARASYSQHVHRMSIMAAIYLWCWNYHYTTLMNRHDIAEF